MAKKRRFATADFETDPFKQNREPKPFCVGVYDGSSAWTYWGDDCIQKFLDYIEDMPPTIFYMHNGGKFDFHFLIEHFRGSIRIINRRIVQARMPNGHEFRDSYSILPVPLKKFNKDEIDYDKFERPVRERYRKQILTYLEHDCVYLYDAVSTFVEEFENPRGIKLTMASAAMSALKQFHSFERLNSGDDALIRPYYYGGRNQCFQTGILKGDWKVFDVNSMYPFAMKNYKHPIGTPTDYGSKRITKRTFFATVEGTNYGALPMRKDDGSLSFVEDHGIFFATIHELNMAEQTGTFKIKRVLNVIDFTSTGSFGDFVDFYYEKRLEAVKVEGKNGPHVTLYKLIMNGAYGKFAQNPDKFMDYLITDNEIPENEEWLPAEEIYNYIIWEKPTENLYEHSYFNVATGASITGASRALLLHGIHRATKPLYCDTDSIICQGLDLPLGDALGQWKIEAEGNLVAIAGKKTYAVLNTRKTYDLKTDCEKKASKGVKLSARQIMSVAKGEQCEFPNPVPNFRLRIAKHRPDARGIYRIQDGRPRFVTRQIKRTA